MKAPAFSTGQKSKLIVVFIFIFILLLSLTLECVAALYSIKKADSFTASARTIIVTSSSGGSEKGSRKVAALSTARFGFFIISEGGANGDLNIEFNENSKLGECELHLYRLTNGIAEEVYSYQNTKNVLYSMSREFSQDISKSIHFYFEFDNKTDYEITINDFEVIANITYLDFKENEVPVTIGDFAFVETFVSNNIHFYLHDRTTVKAQVRSTDGSDAPNRIRLTKTVENTTSIISAEVLDATGNPVSNQDTIDFNIYLPEIYALKMLQIKHGKGAHINNMKVNTLIVDNMLSFTADGLASDFVQITRITGTDPIVINGLVGASAYDVIDFSLETENSDVFINATGINYGKFKLADNKLELGFIKSNNIFVNNIINGTFDNEIPAGTFGELIFEGNGAKVSIKQILSVYKN